MWIVGWLLALGGIAVMIIGIMLFATHKPSFSHALHDGTSVTVPERGLPPKQTVPIMGVGVFALMLSFALALLIG